MKRNTEAIFWARTQRVASGCLEWTGNTSRGYGTFWMTLDGEPKTLHRAHRLAWRFTYGPIPEGLHVLHRCDNPPCVDVEHLYLGTHTQNMTDMVQRGRHVAPGVPGEQHWNARLTEEAVRAMRRLYAEGVSGRRLAKMFGVAERTAYDALQRRTWGHVD